MKQKKTKPKMIEAEKLIGFKPPNFKNSINDKDAILYALSIGFSKDPLRQQDYKYTNQLNQQFTAFPTIGVIIPQSNLSHLLLQHENMPNFSPASILHAQHKFTMFKQKIQIDRQYQIQRELVDIVDKGKNAFILFRGHGFYMNQKNQKEIAFQNQTLMFFKGLGGFKYQGTGQLQPQVQIPERNPDHFFIGQTYPEQAFLYRLNSDRNPLHIDPKISSQLKFERPIIHGLASYGTVGRIFVQNIFNNDPTKLKCLQTRFVGHVYPGQSLQISIWKQDNNKYIYRAVVKQRKTEALVGYVLTAISPKL